VGSNPTASATKVQQTCGFAGLFFLLLAPLSSAFYNFFRVGTTCFCVRTAYLSPEFGIEFSPESSAASVTLALSSFEVI
jgi:hypothetical protein